MADKRVVVTGLGLVCGLGNDVQTCWSNAVNGVTGIDDVKSVDTANCYAHKGAEVDLPNEALSYASKRQLRQWRTQSSTSKARTAAA